MSQPFSQKKESIAIRLVELFPLIGICLMTACQPYTLINSAMRFGLLGVGVGVVIIYSLIHFKILLQNSQTLVYWFLFASSSELLNALLIWFNRLPMLIFWGCLLMISTVTRCYNRISFSFNGMLSCFTERSSCLAWRFCYQK